MNFLTLPNQTLSSNILKGGFFAQADLPAHIAPAFDGFSDATDALINVALSSVFNTAPESDEFCLDLDALGLDRDDFEVNDRIEIAVRIFDEDGNVENFGSTDLTIFVDEFLNDGTVLFGLTTRELSHGRVNPSEVARLENEAVDAYLNGETDEVPACLVEEAPEAPAVESPFTRRVSVVELEGEVIGFGKGDREGSLKTSAIIETDLVEGVSRVRYSFETEEVARAEAKKLRRRVREGQMSTYSKTFSVAPMREIFTEAELKIARQASRARR